mmetsp:Transcript_8855/g.12285  ORF Transcript_8855/g.12285 Transcript_8855/m.12285 type:complete len:126 (-) Transcript_8855:987-1364(-)
MHNPNEIQICIISDKLLFYPPLFFANHCLLKISGFLGEVNTGSPSSMSFETIARKSTDGVNSRIEVGTVTNESFIASSGTTRPVERALLLTRSFILSSEAFMYTIAILYSGKCLRNFKKLSVYHW